MKNQNKNNNPQFTQQSSQIAQTDEGVPSTLPEQVDDLALSKQDEPADPASVTNLPMQNEPADDEPIAPPKKRGGVWSILFLLVICGISVVIMIQLALTFNDGAILSFSELIGRADWRYFFLAIGVLAFLMITDFLKYIILLKVATGKFQILTGVKVSLLGRYYDNITPFSAGEPMQVYYLHKKGLSTGKASAVVFARFIFQITVWLLFSMGFLIWQRGVLEQFPTVETARFMEISAWVGWVFMAVIPVLVVVLSLMPRVFGAVVTFLLKIGKAIRIVKNPDATKTKLLKTVGDYRRSFGIVAKKPVAVVLLSVLCILEPFATMVFPYFLLLAFAKDSLAVTGLPLAIQVIALHVFATFSVTYTPTPGNTGFLEATFTTAFQAIAGVVTFWVVFSWRFMTYYVYILIGLGISVFELIRKGVRASRARRQGEQFK